MHAIGVATSAQHRGYRNYIRSTTKHGLVPVIMGMGQTWRKWIWRTEQYRKGLELLQSSPDALVAITDVYDVIFLGGKRAIEEKYLELTQGSRKVVFGMENVCGGNCAGRATLEGSLPYINAGASVGYVAEMTLVWKKISEAYARYNTTDDQYAVGSLMRRDPQFAKLVKLDTEGVLIRNMTFAQSLKGYDNIRDVPIMHFPGSLQWPSKMRLFNRAVKTVDGELAEFNMMEAAIVIAMLTALIYAGGVRFFRRHECNPGTGPVS
jgi:hypothetical protein